MSHFASPTFWHHYNRLPKEIQQLADRNYELLRRDPYHPSLRFKRIGQFWSVRVGLKYRALAVEIPEGVLWLWIGSHDEYERLLKRA